MVGLGEQKLIDEGKGKKAREANRRVEITIICHLTGDFCTW
jgi:outer membrane protein OmpA-like peptidoglycan-associated protein